MDLRFFSSKTTLERLQEVLDNDEFITVNQTPVYAVVVDNGFKIHYINFFSETVEEAQEHINEFNEEYKDFNNIPLQIKKLDSDTLCCINHKGDVYFAHDYSPTIKPFTTDDKMSFVQWTQHPLLKINNPS